MATRNPYIRKRSDIKSKYGEQAAKYFDDNPKCEHCGEDRIVTLNVHHTQGKQVEEFEILCHNCHMIEHSTYPTYTAEDYNKYLEDTVNKSNHKDSQILDLLKEGTSIREIIPKLSTSIGRIKRVMAENGYISKDRSGYRKE